MQIYDTAESELKLNDVFEFIGVVTLDTELKVDKDDYDEFSNGLSEDLSVQFPPDMVLMHFELFHHFLLSSGLPLDVAIS